MTGSVAVGSNGAGRGGVPNAVSDTLLLDSGRIAVNDNDVTTTPAHARREARLATGLFVLTVLALPSISHNHGRKLDCVNKLGK